MPTYVYKVKNSNQTFEYKQSINDKPLEFLPKDIEGYDETNPKEVERILTPNVNFLFHGSDLSNTYDMNNVDFYFSRLYRVNLNNSYGRYVNFESCILASSTFKNAEFKNSFFIGTVADSSLADSSKFIDTDLTYGIFNSSSFNYVKFTGSRLDYIRFDSVYAYCADFCLTSRVSANFDSLRVDDKTLCSPSSTESSSEIK